MARLDANVACFLLRSAGVTLACGLTAAPLALGGSRLVAGQLGGTLGKGLGFALLAAVGLAAGGALARLQLYVVVGALGDRRITPAAAWRAMRGHTIRLIAAYVIAAALAGTAAMVGVALGADILAGSIGLPDPRGITLPSDGGPLHPATLAVEALVRTIGYALSALNATILAATCRHVLGDLPGTAGTLASADEVEEA
jgi:hypothetical protein